MKLILPEQITEAQYKAYLADWGTERIVPSERRKGYAKRMLAECLAYCRQCGLTRVLITCKAENEASRRTILAGGGVYENTAYCATEDTHLQRYWITL